MFERFDALVRSGLADASVRARHEDRIVSTDHLLLGALQIVTEDPGVEELAQVLEGIGLNVETLLAGPQESVDVSRSAVRLIANLRYSPRARQTLELAVAEAERLDDHQVQIRHLLLALADQTVGTAVTRLRDLQVDLDLLHSALLPVESRCLGRIEAPEVLDVPDPRQCWALGGTWRLTPDFDALPGEILKELENRLQRVPFDRIHRQGDYWAVLAVEHDHIRRLARRFELSDAEQQSLDHWWHHKLQGPLSGVIARIFPRPQPGALSGARSRSPRWVDRSPTFLRQLWFNTLGPGGRCWFGNRYATIRHYTFRLRWRP
jgi:Clp amino terminal domain, pathogenicity island component